MNKFLQINSIPRTLINRIYKTKEGKTNLLLILPLKEGNVEMWVNEKYVFTNNYTLDFTLSLVEDFKYNIKLKGENKELTGKELYNLIHNK